MTDPIDINHLAVLANIKLTKKEKKRFKKELISILRFIDIIQKAKTENIPPTFQVTEAKNISRLDIKKVSLLKKEALKNASQKKGNYFKVVKII